MAVTKAHNLENKFRTDDIRINENVDFEGLFLSKHVLEGLKNSGFKRPSPIQLKAIPLGRCGLDLVVQAKSGTGKTCVFTVIALENIIVENKNVQTLILAPTREIAVQIGQVITDIGKYVPNFRCHVFIGGTPFTKDKFKLRHCQIAVGTPGRVKQLLEEGYLPTESIRLFILDEADKLIDEGFQESINWIYSNLPENKQMIALSATYPEALAQLLTRYMRDPNFVRLNASNPSLLGVKQFFKVVPRHALAHKVYESKVDSLLNVLSSLTFNQCLVFCNSQTRAQTLSNILYSHGWPTTYLAGCQDQHQRLQALATLQQYKCRILVSTDLTARGIDAEHVNLVINMEVPVDSDTYLHRIGRAGRYGTVGIAVTLVCEDKEKENLDTMISDAHLKILPLPDALSEALWEPNSNLVTDDDDGEIKTKEEKEITCEKICEITEEKAEIIISEKKTVLTDNENADVELLHENEVLSGNVKDGVHNIIEKSNENLIDDDNPENTCTEIDQNLLISNLTQHSNADFDQVKEVLKKSDLKQNDIEIKCSKDVHNESNENVSVTHSKIEQNADVDKIVCGIVDDNAVIDQNGNDSSLSDDSTTRSSNKIDLNFADISSDALSVSNILNCAEGKIPSKENLYSPVNGDLLSATTKKKTNRTKLLTELHESSSSFEEKPVPKEASKKHKHFQKHSQTKKITHFIIKKNKVQKHEKIDSPSYNNNAAVLKNNGTDDEISSTYQSSLTDFVKANDTADIVSEESSHTSSITFSPIMKEGDLDDDIGLSDCSNVRTSADSAPSKQEILSSLISALSPTFSKEQLNFPGNSYNELAEDLAAFIAKYGCQEENVVDDKVTEIEKVDIGGDLLKYIGKEENKSESQNEVSPTPIPHCIHSYIEWVLANKEKYLLPPEVLSSLNEFIFKHEMRPAGVEPEGLNPSSATNNEDVPFVEFNSVAQNKASFDEMINLTEVHENFSINVDVGKQESRFSRSVDNEVEKSQEDVSSINAVSPVDNLTGADDNLEYLPSRIPELEEIDRQISVQKTSENHFEEETSGDLLCRSRQLSSTSSSSSSSSTKEETVERKTSFNTISSKVKETEDTESAADANENNEMEDSTSSEESSTSSEETSAEKPRKFPFSENFSHPFSCVNQSKQNKFKSKKSPTSNESKKKSPPENNCCFSHCHHMQECVFCQCAFWTMYFQNLPKPCNSCSCCNYWNYYCHSWGMFRMHEEHNREKLQQCKCCRMKKNNK